MPFNTAIRLVTCPSLLWEKDRNRQGNVGKAGRKKGVLTKLGEGGS